MGNVFRMCVVGRGVCVSEEREEKGEVTVSDRRDGKGSKGKGI